MDDNTPVLVGCGQLTDHDGDGQRSPVDLMAESARSAAEDAGVGKRLLDAVDTLSVVGVIGWHYDDAPGLLAHRLGIAPARTEYTSIGGNTPQWLVNRSCRAIARGDIGVALLTGGEAIAGRSRARRQGHDVAWEKGMGGKPELIGDLRPGTSDHEDAHGLVLPLTNYPLFENALRAKAGRSPQEHLAYLGAMYERFSEIAANNPRAWFRTKRSAEELATPSAENRMVAWPYPKYLNAVMSVDQSASLILTSVGRARELGIDESRWVFLHGCGDANDLWYMSERRDFTSSPALAEVARQSFEMAGVGVGEIETFDLYSCFPSAVQIARDAIGIPEDDGRPLTVTGGLAAHGGAGNNYVMHSIATTVERVREKRGSLGLVTGLGWYMTKHSLGIYGTAPPKTGGNIDDPADCQTRLDGMQHPALDTKPSGRASVETYTVPYDRDLGPQPAIIVGRLDSGVRFLARTANDPQLLEELVESEGVGRKGSVSAGDDGINLFTPS
jgi:acetyl-CoA C-acetyltransferase